SRRVEVEDLAHHGGLLLVDCPRLAGAVRSVDDSVAVDGATGDEPTARFAFQILARSARYLLPLEFGTEVSDREHEAARTVVRTNFVASDVVDEADAGVGEALDQKPRAQHVAAEPRLVAHNDNIERARLRRS